MTVLGQVVFPLILYSSLLPFQERKQRLVEKYQGNRWHRLLFKIEKEEREEEKSQVTQYHFKGRILC